MSKRSAKSPRVVAATRTPKPPVGPKQAQRARPNHRQAEYKGTLVERMFTIGSPNPMPLLRRVPAAAWLCALIAVLNAVSWSFITPPFQNPDEPDHFSYVKQLAETGSRPVSGTGKYTPETVAVLEALHYTHIRQGPSNRAIFTQSEQNKLEEVMKTYAQAGEKGSPDAGVAYAEPPLYYALETIPYDVGAGGSLLDRVQLARMFSALFAGLTALFAFLFVRETLPRVRWAWIVGGLGVAVAPLLGSMSGAVNPDSLLFAVSAALFYCLARAFRRGLTIRLAIATGFLIAAGFATKLNFIGIAPGVFAGLAIVGMREVRRNDRGAWRAPALGAAIGCAPVALYVVSNVLSGAPALGSGAGTLSTFFNHRLLARVNYIWQFFLPRIPGTTNDFPGLFPARQIWFDGYIGRFGWLDTFFPEWVYTVAFIAALALAALCIRALFAGRSFLRGRVPELATYGLIVVGLFILVGSDSYQVFPEQPASFGQTRYLLPLLPLLAAVFALAARGAGRRWGPVVGTLLVLLLFGHDLFSQLQVIARYYG